MSAYLHILNSYILKINLFAPNPKGSKLISFTPFRGDAIEKNLSLNLVTSQIFILKYFLSIGIWLLLALILGCSDWAYSQNQVPDYFEYLSPLPSSKFITPQQDIVFRFNKPSHQFELSQVEVLTIGSISEEISGDLILADDHKTFIFKPNLDLFLP